MTADAQWPLQGAIHAALVADVTLDGLISGRVYDHVPQDSVYPYLVIGDATARDFDTKTEDGMEHTLTVHSWSRYRGLSEAKAIMAATADVLDGQGLTVTGHALTLIRFEFSATFLEPDGLTRHGVQRFRAITTKQ